MRNFSADNINKSFKKHENIRVTPGSLLKQRAY